MKGSTVGGVCHVPRQVTEDGVTREDSDAVAEEIPVAMVYNGVSHVVMLATPADLEDFARGFSLTEGIVADRDEIFDIEVETLAEGIELRVRVAMAAEAGLRARRRNLAGRTGCGLCGAESLAQVRRPIAAVEPVRVAADSVAAALGALDGRQPLRAVTGAVHAAALVAPNGDLLVVREDVGRHNALDKLVGAIDTPEQGCFVLVTSRASFEMVQKTAAAGIGAIVAVSAPTALAIEEARRLGVSLLGFASSRRCISYV